ncbi:MAG: hypothetical protein L6R35_006092 [Caloplaca aegaea]|nr:MAG: hypothetical protein L6R35_006092 [Caloplaca aegaea]
MAKEEFPRTGLKHQEPETKETVPDSYLAAEALRRRVFLSPTRVTVELKTEDRAGIKTSAVPAVYGAAQDESPFVPLIQTAPASATIAHPLPATPVQAVAGETSFVNTHSKTAWPAPAEATPTYVSGRCRMKINQYQKHEKNSNPTNHFQLLISVKDSEGNQAAYLPKTSLPIGEPITMKGLKGGDFNVIVGKDLGDEPLTDYKPISFNYGGQDFDTGILKCRKGPGGLYEDGDRKMDCNIDC